MKKLIVVLLALSLCFSLSALDLGDVYAVRDALDGYAQGLVDTIPTEVSADNLWADAYIGGLISVPPHFAIGVTAGGGFIKDETLMSNFEQMIGIPFVSKLPGAPVPALSINGRVGGIILPFDVGFHGLIYNYTSDSFNGAIDINSWGVDFRFSLLDQIIIIPAVSVGIGYDHVGVNANINFDSNVGFNFLTEGNMLSATAQASWKLLFIKLFGGIRAVMPLGDGVKASATVSAAGTNLNFNYANTNTSVQLIGGFALRLIIFDNTFGVTYDMSKGSFGGSASIRLQL